MPHIRKHAWKYTAAGLAAGLATLNWPAIKAAICAVLCSP